MTYRNRPIDPDRARSDASGPIKINFSDYSDTFDINHIEIDDASEGKHFKLDLTNSLLESDEADDEIRLANGASVFIPGNFILTYSRLISGGSLENIDITDGLKTQILDVLTNVTEEVNGWYTDPSGTLIKWGMSGVSFVASTTDYTVTLPTSAGVPVFTTAPLILPFLRVAEGESAASLSLKSSTTTEFIVNTDLSGASKFSIAYIAIGT